MTGGTGLTPFQQRVAGVAFIAAPLLMLVPDVSSLVLQSGEFYWTRSLTFWCSFWAYTGVAWAMVHLAGNTRMATIGGVLAGLGALIGITLVGLDRMAWAVARNGGTPELLRSAASEPLLFFTSRMPGIFFPVGLLVLTASLRKAEVLSRLSTAILAVGIVLFPVGRIPEKVVFNVVGDVLMLVVLGPLGLGLLMGADRPTA